MQKCGQGFIEAVVVSKQSACKLHPKLSLSLFVTIFKRLVPTIHGCCKRALFRPALEMESVVICCSANWADDAATSVVQNCDGLLKEIHKIHTMFQLTDPKECSV